MYAQPLSDLHESCISLLKLIPYSSNEISFFNNTIAVFRAYELKKATVVTECESATSPCTWTPIDMPFDNI
jgi:hypothetical protein